MTKRLKYEKFNNMENVITIDLHNDYLIIALIGQVDLNTYNVQLMFKEKTVDRWNLIEKAEHLTFNATSTSIYSAILKTVSDYLDEGFFDFYINRYEYDLKCFDIGNDILERENLGVI